MVYVGGWFVQQDYGGIGCDGYCQLQGVLFGIVQLVCGYFGMLGQIDFVQYGQCLFVGIV